MRHHRYTIIRFTTLTRFTTVSYSFIYIFHLTRLHNMMISRPSSERSRNLPRPQACSALTLWHNLEILLLRIAGSVPCICIMYHVLCILYLFCVFVSWLYLYLDCVSVFVSCICDTALKFSWSGLQEVYRSILGFNQMPFNDATKILFHCREPSTYQGII